MDGLLRQQDRRGRGELRSDESYIEPTVLTVAIPLAVMTLEHEHVGMLLAKLGVLTDDSSVPADGGRSCTARFSAPAQLEEGGHLHVHKETNQLLRRSNGWRRTAIVSSADQGPAL